MLLMIIIMIISKITILCGDVSEGGRGNGGPCSASNLLSYSRLGTKNLLISCYQKLQSSYTADKYGSFPHSLPFCL